MSSRYDIGPYGVNNYSASTNQDADFNIVATETVAAGGSRMVAASELITSNAWLFAEAKTIAGAGAVVSGYFSLYAEPKFVTQVAGEAYLDLVINLNARPSTIVDGSNGTADCFAAMLADAFGGKFWDPEQSGGLWTPKVPLNDIWVREGNPPPWSN